MSSIGIASSAVPVPTILDALVTESPATRSDDEARVRLVLLLADFLGCVRGSGARTSSFSADGVAGTAASLALRASARDRDDVDWRSLHHPGSVVWPVVVALGAAGAVSGSTVVQAARRGYATAATVADALGPGHRRSWHVTATAGSVAAASAAGVLLGLDDQSRGRALRLAMTNAGGLSRAATERRGAAAFNRAAAVTLGILAARGAAAGVAAVDDPLTGVGGMAAAMAGASDAADVRWRDGLDDVGVRLHPTSGFLQGVAVGAARARGHLDGDLVGLEVRLTEAVLPLVGDRDAGAWWDARATALRAWATGDPSSVDRPGPLDADPALVELVAGDVRPGASQVTAVTDRGRIVIGAVPVGIDDPDLGPALDRKWAPVLGADSAALVPQAQDVIAGDLPLADLVTGWLS